MDTRTTPQLDALITHLVDNENAPRFTQWATDMNRARNNGTVVSMKTWLKNHDAVETIQARFTDTGSQDKIIGGWVPGPREIAHYATYATLNGSRRYYAGVTCVTSTSEVWVGWDSEARTLVCYSAI